MTNTQSSILERLLETQLPGPAVAAVMETLQIPSALIARAGSEVSRAELSAALNLLLYTDLLDRVSTARKYVWDTTKRGRRIVFDHGALRTVALSGMGDLPAGEQAITRVLVPLGYTLNHVYPLDRLGMTGRSYVHADFPEELPQFFVSELHPERFSPVFQAAVARVTGTSRDPLSAAAQQLLRDLSAQQRLSFAQAALLLPELIAGFQRQHTIPTLRDYETLLAESAEMAWISTEGNAFNHATDRVKDIESLVAEQRALGRPIKDIIEISASGRVRQTAFKADSVEREFLDDGGKQVRRKVPGSFYEFIQRERMHDPVTGVSKLDLAFDSANAQGIFRMTAAA